MISFRTRNRPRLAPPTGAGRRRDLTRSIRGAYAAWLPSFPRWANSGFDEYFLLHDALPLLTDMMAGALPADPAHLARRWTLAYGLTGARAQRALVQCTPAAAEFLRILRAEHRAWPAM
jgi:hypothetical protein